MTGGRLNRYMAAVSLAQEILQGNPRHDELRIQQALDDLVDEIRAGRRNQADFAVVAARLAEAGAFSVRVDEPHLRLVTPEEFDDLVREGA